MTLYANYKALRGLATVFTKIDSSCVLQHISRQNNYIIIVALEHRRLTITVSCGK